MTSLIWASRYLIFLRWVFFLPIYLAWGCLFYIACYLYVYSGMYLEFDWFVPWVAVSVFGVIAVVRFVIKAPFSFLILICPNAKIASLLLSLVYLLSTAIAVGHAFLLKAPFTFGTMCQYATISALLACAVSIVISTTLLYAPAKRKL